MTALQTWLQYRNKRMNQDAIDEALMEYIEKVDRELAQHQAALAEQKETIDRLTKLATNMDGQLGKRPCQNNRCVSFNGQAALIETLAEALAMSISRDVAGRHNAAQEALAAYTEWKESR